MSAGQEFGFVCPDWAKPHWNLNECTIMECTDGTYAVVDHSLNGVTIYVEKTREECAKHLN